jgi:hypothetical protein
MAKATKVDFKKTSGTGRAAEMKSRSFLRPVLQSIETIVGDGR